MSERTIVVGAGIAGLTTALTLSNCVVLTRPGFGSSELAQGGIAAAVGEHDTPPAHAADTLAVAAGIAEDHVAATITAEAPERIRWLQDLGARFDRDADGRLALGREAGHRRRRIVHADGDATGAEVMRTLTAAVQRRADITVLEGWDLVDLLRTDDGVAGVVALDPAGSAIALAASAVVLATGGIGAAYLHTTNPPEVAGDGLAAAARAGARLADLEFVQFHPTALAVAADPLPLLTEALRGEGAVLIDDTGRRFMPDIHPRAELAPRDVVARAISARIRGGARVFLDATDAVGRAFPERFPTVWAAATGAGIDPRSEPMPVTPAEHYHMGGIATDADGRTSLPGLWAAGEVASTGLHGANRLASNSLLEGMVVGAHVATSIRSAGRSMPTTTLHAPVGAFDVTRPTGGASTDRETLWDHVGIVRDADGLTTAISRFDRPPGSDLRSRNLPLVGRLIAEAALARRESRGAHHRTDHPHPDPSMARRSFTEPAPASTAPVRLRNAA